MSPFSNWCHGAILRDLLFRFLLIIRAVVLGINDWDCLIVIHTCIPTLKQLHLLRKQVIQASNPNSGKLSMRVGEAIVTTSNAL
jgi:hypothetical protein